MIIQTVISQSYDNIENTPITPPITWGALDTGFYPLLPLDSSADVWIPTTIDVMTYNHHPHIIEFEGDLHCIFSTSDTTEQNTSYARYSKSTDGGVTWSTPIEIVPLQDDMSKDYLTTTSRQVIPTGLAVIDNELFAVFDINDQTFSNPIPRVGIGVMARKINNNSTFGTLYWIENITGNLVAPTEISGYPVYSFDIPLRNKIRDYVIANPDKRFVWYQGVPLTDYLSTEGIFNTFRITEPEISKLPNNSFIRLWRITDPLTKYKVAQTSNNGNVWNDNYVTEIPDSPSKTEFFNSMGDIILIGNNQTGRNNLFFAMSEDGYDYKLSNIYTISQDTTAIQFAGFGKTVGSQYPSAITLSNGKICCIYSRAKEKIRVSIFDKPTII